MVAEVHGGPAPRATLPEVLGDQLPERSRSAQRLKLGLGALAILCVNLGIGLFAREQQRSILDHAANIYDTAVTSTTYIHEARIQFQKYIDQRLQARSRDEIETANAFLTEVIDDLDVAIERADSPKTRTLGSTARAQVAALADDHVDDPLITDKLSDLQVALENLGKMASSVVLRARDEIDVFSSRSDYMLLASIVTSVLLAGLSLYLLSQVVAASTLARITHLASHDALTGLPNRLMLHGRLAERLEQARRGGLNFALLSLVLTTLAVSGAQIVMFRRGS